LEQKIREWLPDFQIEDFTATFQLEYLTIPSCEEEIKEWEIVFFATGEIQHWCSINMREMKVTNILIDG
jgi:hypothetical protein